MAPFMPRVSVERRLEAIPRSPQIFKRRHALSQAQEKQNVGMTNASSRSVFGNLVASLEPFCLCDVHKSVDQGVVQETSFQPFHVTKKECHFVVSSATQESQCAPVAFENPAAELISGEPSWLVGELWGLSGVYQSRFTCYHRGRLQNVRR